MNPVNQGKLWAPSEMEKLVYMFNRGATLTRMCEELGRTPLGVMGKLESMGVVKVGSDGHYYPAPTEPWVMWQEVRELVNQYKQAATEGKHGTDHPPKGTGT